MRRRVPFAIVAAVVLGGAVMADAQRGFEPETLGGERWIPYRPASMRFGLTPEQAADRVRVWMQDQNLQLEVVGIATDGTDEYLQLDPWPTWEWELQYLLRGSDGKHYFVRIHPWVSIEYYDITADTPLGPDASLYLGDAQRQTIAEAFARARGPDLWSVEHQQEHYGRVMARYQGVRHPLRCAACSVHPTTGALIRSVVADPGVPSIPLTPTVSGAAAQGMAIPFLLQSCAYAGAAPSNAGGREQHLFVFSDPMTLVHRLAWSIPLTATRDKPPVPTGIWYEHDVYVDAHSGEPFYVESYLGGGSSPSGAKVTRRGGSGRPATLPLLMAIGSRELQTAMPPLLIGGRPYLWAGWLRNSLLQGDATLVACAAGRLTVQRTGKRVILPAKPYPVDRGVAPTSRRSALVRGGRCYVPLDVARGLLAMRVTYEPRSRTVRFSRLVRPAENASR